MGQGPITGHKDLARELPIYIDNVRVDERFAKLNSIFAWQDDGVDFSLGKLSTKARTCSSYRYCISGEVLFSDKNCEDRTA